MRVIFLDIDGVLNSGRFFIKLNNIYSGTGIYPKPEDKLDPELISRLNQITEATGAFIVVSSTWRMGYRHNIAGLRELLSSKGVTGKILGITPIDSRIRGLQIADWIEQHTHQRGPLESYVIIDDNSDMGSLMERLVLTSYEHGLTDADVDRAIAILNTRLNNA